MTERNGRNIKQGSVAKDLGIDDKEFCPAVMWPSVKFWELEVRKVDLKLLEIKSESNNLDLVNEFHCHVGEHYQKHILIFSDGSMDPEMEATGADFVVQDLGGGE